MLKFVVRVLVVWSIEVVGLLALTLVLPGLYLESWRTAILGIAVVGLLNALVRPILLFLTLPFTVLSFGVLTLALNALMLGLAAYLLPGLSIADAWTALLAATGLAMINTLSASLLALNDEDSFYRNVVLRIARQAAPHTDVTTPGMLVVEIDGLCTSTLEYAIYSGRMPTLARWLQTGSHSLKSWTCDIPCQTSSSQAGILHGDNFDIPAFRWYEKDRRRLLVSNHPADATEIERQVSNGRGLLHRQGSSVGNLVSGDAERSLLTLSTILDQMRLVDQRFAGLYRYFLNPYSFSRLLLLLVAEIAIEVWEGARQSLRNVQPRVSRRGFFPLLRAVSTVLLRELNVYFVLEEMFTGAPIVYSSFVGYDVVAHHAGPGRPDALRILSNLDGQIASLERAAQRAPRPYHFVILSDHGQSQGATFRQRSGLTLESFVRTLLSGDYQVHAFIGEGEGWGHLNALLSETLKSRGRTARGARRVLRRRTQDGYVELGPRRARHPAAEAQVVVCASGNLGLIYFADWPDRVSFETIGAAFPGLIEGLVGHAGIGFCLVRSEEHGPLVLGRDGIRYLATGQVEGGDPLAPFGAQASADLARLDSFPHVGDIVVNSCYDPSTGEVASFEEMVGSHGGLGGPQTTPFLMFPAEWEPAQAEIIGSTQVHALLRGWLERLQDNLAIDTRLDPKIELTRSP
ncbi:MAG TPA: phage holin family protein [Anaerolineae bacterium]|nr:phage holin family protein [Anaerolineae bacterium]